jgi:hypothetical protein
MVLCEEILQWLTEFESYSSAASSSRRVADSVPLPTPGDLQAATPHAAPVAVKSPSASRAQQRPKSSGEWKMLQQLSHELGKNLGDDGSRSSPLSPSDLAGRCSSGAAFTRLLLLCSCFTGPVSVSISPHGLFQQHSTGRQLKFNSTNTGISSSSSSKRNTKLPSAAATPASTFSSSLGVKLKGSTGRSIDTWLQKHKKNHASTDISQASQAFTPRGEPAAASLSQHRHHQKVQPQNLEAAVALKSKQVDVQYSAFKRRLTVCTRSRCLKNTTACWLSCCRGSTPPALSLRAMCRRS